MTPMRPIFSELASALLFDGPGQLTIGGIPEGQNEEQFTGLLQDIRIFSRRLDAL